MNLFERIKLFITTGREIRNSIKAFDAKLATYRELKSNQIPSLADDELRTAVMGWMQGKFNRSWSNDFEIIQTLNGPCRNVYACCTVIDEIMNGGINQLFYNSTKRFVEMAVTGFYEMHLDELGQIMEKANEIYICNKDLLEQYNDGTIAGFSRSYDEKLFDELDSKVVDYGSQFEARLCAYIRENDRCFGD